MKIIKKLFFTIFLVVFASFFVDKTFAQNSPDLSAFEKTIIDELKETKTPGAAVAIVKNGKIIFSKGFGTANIETNAAVKKDTVFQIGSMTKMLTAAAVLSLAEEGKVKLDAPIGNYLPNLNPKIAKLTLHQLLSQTSGLRDFPGENGTTSENALQTFAQKLTEKDLFFDADKYFSYSNANYSLAGAVLEKVSGKSYQEAMKELVFSPLGMNSTAFQPTLAMTYPLAVAHLVEKDGTMKVVRPFDYNGELLPAGYAYASVSDFANFALTLLEKGKFGGKQIIAENVFNQMLTPKIAIPTNIFNKGYYGYGLFIQNFRGFETAFHAGTQTGFVSEMRSVPKEKFAVIILANKDGARLEKSFNKAFEIFLPGKEIPKNTPPAAFPTMTEMEMQKYVGTYANRFSMDIFIKGGKLFLRRFGAELPMTKIGKNRFSVSPAENISQEFTIDLNREGKAEALRMFIWTFKRNN